MPTGWSNDPFSDAGQHVLMRVFLFFATILLAVFLGSGVAVSTGDHVGWMGGVMLYPVMILGGIAQGWGIFAYGLLGILLGVFILRDISFRWLLLVFLLQGLEAFRWCVSWEIGKP